MYSVCNFILLNNVSIIALFFKFIMILFLICAAFIAIAIYRANKDEKVIAARGGIREMYSELLDAIRMMPESNIRSRNSSLSATYLNNSDKFCNIDVFVAKDYTSVSFSIYYNDEWVQTGKKQFYGNFSGREILWKIIFNFPDCDLSDN